MIMNYSFISRDNILEVIDYFKDNRASCEKLTETFNKHVETTSMGADKYKHIIRDLSESIKVVVIDCQKNIITNMTFYGTLSITHYDLVRLFGEERTVYSFHDDITFYFFNESDSDCTVSYFSDGNNNALNLEAGILNLSLNLAPKNKS